MDYRALVFGLLLLSCFAFAADISACGNVNETSVLTANLLSNGTCLNTTAANITIDCNGFSITGNTSGNGIQINDADVTIRNCILNNYSYGINMAGARGISTNITTHVSNNYGIGITRADASVLNSNLDSTFRAIYVSYAARSIISNNSLSATTSQALYLNTASSATVSNNVLSSPAIPFIVSSSPNAIITNNTINGRRTSSIGLQVVSGANGNSSNGVYVNNTIENATKLLSIGINSSNNTFYWNTFLNGTTYIVDINGGNYFNTTIDGQGEGNIYENILNGIIAANASVESAYGATWKISSIDGSPYDNTTSGNMFNCSFDGCGDYAPLISPSNYIIIFNPNSWRLFQRDNDTHGEIPLVLSYNSISAANNGTEYSFAGGPWTAFTGKNTTITPQVGQGTLTVRATSNHAANVSVNNVSVGDFIIISGQSNACPQFNFAVNSSENDTYYMSQYTTSFKTAPFTSENSSYPLAGSSAMETGGVPIFFIQTCIGGKAIINWAGPTIPKGANLTCYGNLTCYEILLQRVNAATEGKNKVRAMIFYQGEADIVAPPTGCGGVGACYINYTNIMVGNISENINITGGRIVFGQVSQSSSSTAIQNIRQAQHDLWGTTVNGITFIPGPTTYDINATTVHFVTPNEALPFVNSWVYAIKGIYLGDDASTTGPRLLSAQIANASNTTLYLNFNKPVTQIGDFENNSGVLAKGFRFVNANSSRNLNDNNIISTNVDGSTRLTILLNVSVDTSFNLTYGMHPDNRGEMIPRDSSYLPMWMEFGMPLTQQGAQAGALTVTYTAGGTATGSNSTFIPPANLTINATASGGYYFINWSTNCSAVFLNSTNPNTLIQVNDATACYAQANFGKYGNLTVNTTTGGNATGSNSTFIPPANLTINATASTGYYFSNWTESCNGTVANITNPNTLIQVNDATACYAQANFAQHIYTYPCANLSSAGTTYTMNASTNISETTCFNVVADNIILDCAGHSITGNNTPETYGVYSNSSGSIVRNCVISGFDTGIYYYNSSGGQISNNTVSSDANYVLGETLSAGVYLSGSDSNNLSDNQISSVHGFGLTIIESDLNTIKDSTITSTETVGLGFATSDGNYVARCSINGNDSSFGAVSYILFTQNTTMENNTINGNSAPALTINVGGAGNNTFARNTFISATDLVYISSGSIGNLFYWNNFSATTGYYVDDESANNTFTYNVSGNEEGNLYANIASTGINGTIPSAYGAGRYIGNGTYNSTTSSGKVVGMSDTAPLVGAPPAPPPTPPLNLVLMAASVLVAVVLLILIAQMTLTIQNLVAAIIIIIVAIQVIIYLMR